MTCTPEQKAVVTLGHQLIEYLERFELSANRTLAIGAAENAVFLALRHLDDEKREGVG